MFQVFNVLISNFDRLKVQCVEVWSLLCTHTKTSISSLSAHEQNGQLDRNLSFYLERNCQRLYSPQGNWTRTNMLLIKGFKVSRSCQNFKKKKTNMVPGTRPERVGYWDLRRVSHQCLCGWLWPPDPGPQENQKIQGPPTSVNTCLLALAFHVYYVNHITVSVLSPFMPLLLKE